MKGSAVSQIWLGWQHHHEHRGGHVQGLGSLTELSLANNAITSIEAGTFEGLGSLTELSLVSNTITSIEAGTFQGLGSLRI